MNPFINCLKITNSVPSFNSIPFTPLYSTLFDPKSEIIDNPAQERHASERDQGIGHFKEARLYCPGPVFFSLPSDLPVIAGRGSFFCRIRPGLRMMNGATDLGSRERGRCCPLMLKNQGLEEWLLTMCTSCGKKCFNAAYPLNSIM